MNYPYFMGRMLASLKHCAALVSPEDAPVFPPLARHPLAQAGAQILPPFLGEMGLEIRGFLGQVEPWLQAGCMIPARRPAFYPEGRGFPDPEFFTRVDDLKKHFHLHEMVGRLEMPGNLGQTHQFIYDGPAVLQQSRVDDAALLARMASAERALRQAYAQRYLHEGSLPTPWDYTLTSLQDGSDLLVCSGRLGTPPSHRPAAFTRPSERVQAHVGLQVRNVAANPSRNSDPERMRRLAETASRTLGLPMIVYGRYSDLTLPGLTRSADLLDPGEDQMAGELAFLSRCRLMVSPDSGWADLMGWLRIPTLLERQVYASGFEALRPFRPRIALSLPEIGLEQRIRALADAGDQDTFLPDPGQAEFPVSHLPPDSAAVRDYWSEFRK